MSQHVPDDLLAAFVEGDMGEQLAVHIAEHIDSCPSCLNRATGMEPLHAAFAALPDPEVPADLVAAVLAEAAEPERLPVTEIGVSAGLLVAAATVAVMFGNPVGAAAEFGVVLYALGDLSRVVAAGLSQSLPVLVGITVVVMAGLIFTARFAIPADVAGFSPKRRLL